MKKILCIALFLSIFFTTNSFAVTITWIQVTSDYQESEWRFSTGLGLSPLDSDSYDVSFSVNFGPPQSMNYLNYGTGSSYDSGVIGTPRQYVGKTFVWTVKDKSSPSSISTITTIPSWQRQIAPSTDITLSGNAIHPTVSWKNVDPNLTDYLLRVVLASDPSRFLWESGSLSVSQNKTYTIDGFSFQANISYLIRIEARERRYSPLSGTEIGFVFTNRSTTFYPYSFSSAPLGDAVDAPHLTWTTGGDNNWFGQTQVTWDGVDAAQSGPIAHSQQTWMETTVQGPGTISFYWQVSSEFDHDFLLFYIGSSLQESISGDVTWEHKSFSVPQGSQTLRWVYSKDNIVNDGSDCGWVDDVVYTNQIRDELALNFPGYGLYQYDKSGGWKLWNTVNPSQMVTVDFNGDGTDELVAAFPDYGLYRKDTANDWQPINTVNPEKMIAADIDGDSKDELVAGFAGYGLYYYDDLGGWSPPINTVIPDAMVRYSEGVICDYGEAYGLWSYNTSGGWALLNAEDPDKIVAADIDGDGEDELVVSFVGWGLYSYEPVGNIWQRINTVIPDKMLAMDIDGDRNDELVISFSGYGLYVFEPEGLIWQQPPINTVIPDDMIRYGNGIVCDFGSAYGLWYWTLEGGWRERWNDADLGQMVAVDIDRDGVEELVVSFTDFGLYYRDETSGWQFLSTVVPEDMKPINFYP
jgi:hypothetical protein